MSKKSYPDIISCHYIINIYPCFIVVLTIYVKMYGKIYDKIYGKIYLDIVSDNI